MHLVLRNSRHLCVPFADKFSVFVNFLRLDLVEDNGVDIFAAGQNLGKAALDVLVELATFRRAVDERRERPTLLLAALLLSNASFFCVECQ